MSNVDLVINAIGIIEGDFEQVQTRSPLEMFEACIQKNIRIINISAVGAEKENISIPFLKTKKVTDSFLLSYEKARIIYPGIVIGKGGQSTQFFTEMSKLPMIPLIKTEAVPAIHISQLTELVKKVAENFENYPKQIFAVAKPEPLEKIISAIKGKKAVIIKLPLFIFNAIFTLFPNASIGIFNKNMMSMLTSISAKDYKPVAEEVSTRINPRELISSNYLPQMAAVAAIAFIWLWSGVSSLISWDESIQLMNEIGVTGLYASIAVYLGSFADIILGLAIFLKKKKKLVLVLQILFIVIYTIILSVFAPHYWLHPFGVLSKNIPLIALSFYLYRQKTNNP